MQETIYTNETPSGRGRGVFRQGVDMAKSFLAMVRDRNYRFPRRLKLLTVVSIIYLISPIDLVPDIIPVLGFADDIALLIGTFTMLLGEIEKYRTRNI